MQGHNIMTGEGAQARGMLDPHSLDQSGSAPGALVFPKNDSEGAGDA